MAARRQRPLITGEVLPAGVQAAVLSRAGGNPLYAQEFARLVLERGPTADSDEVPVPDSLQGLIAPRLDALPREEKEVLQDAAVVGKAFWRGALVGANRTSDYVAKALSGRSARRDMCRAASPCSLPPRNWRDSCTDRRSASGFEAPLVLAGSHSEGALEVAVQVTLIRETGGGGCAGDRLSGFE
jgi:hypothetical protein